MKSCFNVPEFKLDTVVMKKICKYHKRKGQEYAPNDVIRNFCADAFYVAYPYCLALLYDANKNEFYKGEIKLHCPNSAGIEFEVKRIPAWSLPVRMAKKIFDWFMAKFIMRVDWENWHIQLKITQNQGNCPAYFSVGDSYWFNIRRLGELCPASFHGIYPVLLSHILGHKFLCGRENKESTIHCPDHEGMIYAVISGDQA